MTDDQPEELQQQLEAARERVKQLEQEREEMLLKMQQLENKWANYKPLADAWLRQHMPSKEECEKELQEALAHPETWLSFEDILRELDDELRETSS